MKDSGQLSSSSSARSRLPRRRRGDESPINSERKARNAESCQSILTPAATHLGRADLRSASSLQSNFMPSSAGVFACGFRQRPAARTNCFGTRGETPLQLAGGTPALRDCDAPEPVRRARIPLLASPKAISTRRMPFADATELIATRGTPFFPPCRLIPSRGTPFFSPPRPIPPPAMPLRASKNLIPPRGMPFFGPQKPIATRGTPFLAPKNPISTRPTHFSDVS